WDGMCESAVKVSRGALGASITLMLLLAHAASAQEPPMPEHHHMDAPPQGWAWSTDAAIFAGFNYQERKFTDFSAWESQNWFMLAGERPAGRGTLSVDGMLSLEPFTFEKRGSPQVFQTGEVYHGGPNIDRQHPHDLIMG